MSCNVADHSGFRADRLRVVYRGDRDALRLWRIPGGGSRWVEEPLTKEADHGDVYAAVEVYIVP